MPRSVRVACKCPDVLGLCATGGLGNDTTVLHAAQAIKNNKSEKEVYSKSLAGVNTFDIVFLRFPGPVCNPLRVVMCCVFVFLVPYFC